MRDKYAAALDGDALDLGELRRWFYSDQLTITEIEVPLRGRVPAMLAREFDGLPSGEKVQATAWRLIGQMNGVLFATSASRKPVRVLGVYERTADGGWGPMGAYATGRISGSGRVRAYAEAIGADGLPSPAAAEAPRQAAWFALASGADDPNPAADVLRALSSEPDWSDLWKAEEVMHPTKDRIPDWPESEIEWFRQTATLYRHSPSSVHVQGPKNPKKQGRDGAKKHGRDGAKQWLAKYHKPEMELDAARRLIASVAAQWLDWKATPREAKAG